MVVARLPRMTSVHRRRLRREGILETRVGGKEEREYSSSEFGSNDQELSLWERIRMEVGVALVPSTQPKEYVAMQVKVQS